MNYKIREGIVMETLCGTSLLIATLEARKYCPYVMQLNEASAYIWQMLFDGKTYEEMIKRAAEDFEISVEQAGETIESFLSDLIEKKYLIPEGSEGEENEA